MTNFLDQLNKAKQRVQLPPERKAAVRDHLQKSMAGMPVRARTRVSIFALVFSRSAIIPLAVLAVLLSGAATTYAAQGSLPGDNLYLFKLNFNEKVKTALVFSNEQKAEAQLTLFEDRLDEAVKLSADNHLNSEKAAYLEELFDSYEAAAQHRIDKLNEQGKTEAASLLSTRLEALISIHERILAQLENQNSVGLQDTLKERSDQQEAEANNSEKHADQFKMAAENKINAAAKVLAHVDGFINNQSARTSEESKTAATTKLGTANSTLDNARQQWEDGQYEEAFRSANSAIRISLEAKTVLRLGSQFQVHIELKDEPGEVHGASDESNKNNLPNRGNSDNHGQQNKIQSH